MTRIPTHRPLYRKAVDHWYAIAAFYALVAAAVIAANIGSIA